MTHVLSDAVEAGELSVEVPETIVVERPKSRDHGDWASNIALQLAKRAGLAPRQLAEILAGRLREREGIAEVEIAGPGFINITVEASAAGQLARTIVEAGETFGRNSGLGLSIARQIIEGAGGRIYAENRSPDNQQGAGARLIVELPLAHV